MAEFKFNPFTANFDIVKTLEEAIAHADLSDMPDVGGTVTDHDVHNDARYLELDGTGVMTGDIDMGDNKLRTNTTTGVLAKNWGDYALAIRNGADTNWADILVNTATAYAGYKTPLGLIKDGAAGVINIRNQYDTADFSLNCLNLVTVGDTDVGGELDVVGHSAFGASTAISSNYLMHADDVFTHLTGVYAVEHLDGTHTPSAPLSAVTNMIGSYTHSRWMSAEDGSVNAYVYGSKLEAISASSIDYSTGDVNTLLGVLGIGRHSGSGAATTVVGAQGHIINDDAFSESGHITTASSLLASGFTDKSSGTISTRYGLNIEDVTGGGLLTNQYGIYCPALTGASGDNLFIKNTDANSDFGSGNISTTGTVTGINITSGADPGHTHTGASLGTIDISDDTNLVGGSGVTLTDDTLDLDINSLSVATIAAGDFVPFWDITATATNKKITFANLEGTIDHGNIAGLSTGADHSYIDQSVISGATPTFTGTNITAVASITAADESADTTCFPLFATAATGAIAPKTGTNLTFNSNTGALVADRLEATTDALFGTTLGIQTGQITDTGGTIDFDNEHLQTTGNLTDGVNSLTVANAKTAYDHSQDNSQAHTDYLLNTTDQMDGNLTIDNTTTTALTVRKNAAGGDALVVDTTNLVTNIPASLRMSTTGAHMGWSDAALTNPVNSNTTQAIVVGTDAQIGAWLCVGAAGAWTYNLELSTAGAVEGDNWIIWVRMSNTTDASDHFIIKSGVGGSTLKDITGDGTTHSWGVWAFYVINGWYLFWVVDNDL